MLFSENFNQTTQRLIDSFIPKRIVPFDYYLERSLDFRLLELIETNQSCKLLVTGEAGLGKTSLLSNLAKKLINKSFAIIYVKSENLGNREIYEQIMIDADIDRSKHSLTKVFREIHNKEKRKILILLDTLDTIVDAENITKLRNFIDHYSGNQRFIIGVSRPLEAKELLDMFDDQVAVIEIFEDKEIDDLFQRYKSFYKMEGENLNDSAREICRIPLHLRLLFEVYKPNEIPSPIDLRILYQRYWELKVARIRSESTFSHPSLTGRKKIAEAKVNLTLSLALDMLYHKNPAVPENDFRKSHQPAIMQNIGDISQSDFTHVTQNIHIRTLILGGYVELVDNAYYDLLDEGVLRVSGGKVEFFHQTYFEFSAAKALLLERDQCENILKESSDALFFRPIFIQCGIQAYSSSDEKLLNKIIIALSESSNFFIQMAALDIYSRLEEISPFSINTVQKMLFRSNPAMRYLFYLAMKTKNTSIHEIVIQISNKCIKEKSWLSEIAETIPNLVSFDPTRTIQIVQEIGKTLHGNRAYLESKAILYVKVNQLSQSYPDLLKGVQDIFRGDPDLFLSEEIETQFRIESLTARQLSSDLNLLWVWVSGMGTAGVYIRNYPGHEVNSESVRRLIEEAALSGNENSYKQVEIIFLWLMRQADEEKKRSVFKMLAEQSELLLYWLPSWLLPNQLTGKKVEDLLKMELMKNIKEFSAALFRVIYHLSTLMKDKYETLMSKYKDNKDKYMLEWVLLGFLPKNSSHVPDHEKGWSDVFYEMLIIDPLGIANMVIDIRSAFGERLGKKD